MHVPVMSCVLFPVVVLKFTTLCTQEQDSACSCYELCPFPGGGTEVHHISPQCVHRNRTVHVPVKSCVLFPVVVLKFTTLCTQEQDSACSCYELCPFPGGGTEVHHIVYTGTGQCMFLL